LIIKSIICRLELYLRYNIATKVKRHKVLYIKYILNTVGVISVLLAIVSAIDSVINQDFYKIVNLVSIIGFSSLGVVCINMANTLAGKKVVTSN